MWDGVEVEVWIDGRQGCLVAGRWERRCKVF